MQQKHWVRTSARAREWPARWLAAAVALLLLAATLPGPAAPVAVAQTDPSGLDTIQATYGDLLDDFYRPVAPADLLNAAWQALSDAVTRRGLPTPPPLTGLPSDRGAAFAAFSTAYHGYFDSLSNQIDASTAADVAGEAMAQSVHEQHTNYLTASEYRSFLTEVGGGQQSQGLGVQLSGGQPGLIIRVVPGGPADQAGVRAGDVIVGADGTDLSKLSGGALSRALAGPIGATIQLSVDRGSGPQTFAVTRGPFYDPPLSSRLLPSGAGYLRLSEFALVGTTLPDGTELLDQLDIQLNQLDSQGANGLVLDLRNNGGGSITTAEELLGRFLPENIEPIHTYDLRGHDSYDLVSGLMRSKQLPMAVLVNGGSASASEVVAGALRDTHRAVLVGQTTAGAVAESELFPVPDGGALQIAVEGAQSGVSGNQLDGVGVPVDVSVADTRTVEDYRNGNDPQLNAAVAALEQAAAPPAVQTTPTDLTAAQLDQLLSPALPDAASVPTNDRIIQPVAWGREDLTHPNEWVDEGGGAADPLALRDAQRARGYQGSVLEEYANSPGDQPSEGVQVDLYATAEGAHQAMASNDFPDSQQVTASLANLGDESVTYTGIWVAQGSESIVWRRGREVVTVAYGDVPGFDHPETLVALANLVDARVQQLAQP